MSHDSQTSTASPEKKALLEAFDTVLKTKADEHEAELAAAEARRRSRGLSRLLMLVCVTILVFVSAYLYVERPDWIFPTPPPPESLAVREASLRITIATAAQHIERYRQQSGRLPATLTEAGAYGEGITYQTTAASYRLEGESGDLRVVFNSSQPLARFVGNSFRVISRRAPR
jgi:hypothetical protein